MQTTTFIIALLIIAIILLAVGWIKSRFDYSCLFELFANEKQLVKNLREEIENQDQREFDLMIEIQQLSRKPTFKELTEFRQRCNDIYTYTERKLQ